MGCVNNLCCIFKKLWTATVLGFTVIVSRPSRLGLEGRLSTGGKEKPTRNNISCYVALLLRRVAKDLVQMKE